MKSPAFQFYPSDFLSDSNTLVMSAEEIGVYWLLICVCWKENGLPKELKKLSQLARVQEKKFTRLWNETISVCFYFDEKTAQYRHPRLDKELQIQADNKQKKKAAADARWAKSDADALPVHCLEVAEGCSSSSPSSAWISTTTTTTRPPVGNENELSNHWAIALYAKRFGHLPSIAGQEMIVADVVDELVWQRVLDIWRGNEHTARHVWNMVDRYKREVKKDAAGKSLPKARPLPLTLNKEPAGWREHYARELNQLPEFLEGELLEAVKAVLSEFAELTFEEWKKRKEHLLELGLEIV